MWFASAKPPYGTLDAAEWAPSTASKADICAAKVMSALLPKADICSAVTVVRFGPKAERLLPSKSCPLFPQVQTRAAKYLPVCFVPRAEVATSFDNPACDRSGTAYCAA